MSSNALAFQAYVGSYGPLTKKLYADLESLGPVGIIAMNLFRAQKASARAKVYRGGTGGRSFRDIAYEKKDWSLRQLCEALNQHASTLGLTWGWKEDPMQPYHSQVLYVDLPTGQVSFHTKTRGAGPDYTGEWDGQKEKSHSRIIMYCNQLLDSVAQPPTLL